MYSNFFSKIEEGISKVQDRLKEIILPHQKVAILPWAFPVELNSEKLLNEYFKEGEKRYHRYVDVLLSLGLKKEHIFVCDCYGDSSKIKELIHQCDVLVLPGGNPEMLFQKVVHDTELLYDLKYFPGIIIGESAGALLQFKRYFITAKNNFYKYFAYYDGFGIIDNSFYLDVHSCQNSLYVQRLRNVSKEKKCPLYALFDDGAMVYNRQTKNIELFGNVVLYDVK